MKTSYASSDDPTVQNKSLVPDIFGEQHNNTLAFDYYVEAYYVFLQGSDDFTEQDQELEERYGRFLCTREPYSITEQNTFSAS